MRKNPALNTLRALLAKSGNRCAFPGCNQELVTADNLYVGELCHIEAAEPGGPRYNSQSSDDERRSYGNLLLLCHSHHRRVDVFVDQYSIGKLRQLKADHEAAQVRSYCFDELIIDQLESEISSYWNHIEAALTNNPAGHLAVEIDKVPEGSSAFAKLHEYIESIGQLLSELSESDQQLQLDIAQVLRRIGVPPDRLEEILYSENPLFNRNWEYHNLATPNLTLRLTVAALQLEVLYLVAFLKLNTQDQFARLRLDEAKKRLAYIAGNMGYSD